jgi:large subunit ribosomal protein L18e
MFANTLVDNTVWILRKAAKKSKAPIWRDLEDRVSGPRSTKSEVNLGKLAQVTKASEVIVVPGKVLGTGNLGHKLTVCAFSISESATKKITDLGGDVISLDTLITKYPDGKGVRIIG